MVEVWAFTYYFASFHLLLCLLSFFFDLKAYFGGQGNSIGISSRRLSLAPFF